MNKTTSILYCPFCGSNYIKYSDEDSRIIICQDCNYSSLINDVENGITEETREQNILEYFLTLDLEDGDQWENEMKLGIYVNKLAKERNWDTLLKLVRSSTDNSEKLRKILKGIYGGGYEVLQEEIADLICCTA